MYIGANTTSFIALRPVALSTISSLNLVRTQDLNVRRLSVSNNRSDTKSSCPHTVGQQQHFLTCRACLRQHSTLVYYFTNPNLRRDLTVAVYVSCCHFLTSFTLSQSCFRCSNPAVSISAHPLVSKSHVEADQPRNRAF